MRFAERCRVDEKLLEYHGPKSVTVTHSPEYHGSKSPTVANLPSRKRKAKPTLETVDDLGEVRDPRTPFDRLHRWGFHALALASVFLSLGGSARHTSLGLEPFLIFSAYGKNFSNSSPRTASIWSR